MNDGLGGVSLVVLDVSFWDEEGERGVSLVMRDEEDFGFGRRVLDFYFIDKGE